MLVRLGSMGYDGFQLHYEEYGAGRHTVVLLHGILLDAHMNRGLARALARTGNRVVLLDLLGHGRSDRPRHAGYHRMDLYARQVLGLLDHLGVERAVLGGASLGADVALLAAVAAPDRVQALVLEMPVLEWAVPVAGALFIPMLFAAHYARPVLRLVSEVARRLPRTSGPFDSLLGAASLDPDEMAAILHGVLLGPIAPTLDQRTAVTAPALVIGHPADRLHPFSDAENLARQLPNARLEPARSILELRTRPSRLTAEIAGFVERAWSDDEHLRDPGSSPNESASSPV